MSELSEKVEDFGLYHGTQSSFDFVHDNYHSVVPMEYHNLGAEVAGAALLGAAITVEGAIRLSRTTPFSAINFYERALPWCMRTMEIGIPLAAIGYALFEPESFEKAMEKGYDNFGMALQWAYGVLRSELDFARRRSTEDSLLHRFL